MQFERVAHAGHQSRDAVEDVVYTAVVDAISSVDEDCVVSETGVDRAQVTAVTRGDQPRLTMQQVGEVFALTGAYPDEATFRHELQDALIVWMSDAVVDVEDIAAELHTDGTTVREWIEAPESMSISTYASIVAVVQAQR